MTTESQAPGSETTTQPSEKELTPAEKAAIHQYLSSTERDLTLAEQAAIFRFLGKWLVFIGIGNVAAILALWGYVQNAAVQAAKEKTTEDKRIREMMVDVISDTMEVTRSIAEENGKASVELLHLSDRARESSRALESAQKAVELALADEDELRSQIKRMQELTQAKEGTQFLQALATLFKDPEKVDQLNDISMRVKALETLNTTVEEHLKDLDHETLAWISKNAQIREEIIFFPEVHTGTCVARRSILARNVSSAHYFGNPGVAFQVDRNGIRVDSPHWSN